jgi:hypothetical protein
MGGMHGNLVPAIQQKCAIPAVKTVGFLGTFNPRVLFYPVPRRVSRESRSKSKSFLETSRDKWKFYKRILKTTRI